jgi:ankyrin repeat protein
MRTQFKMLCMLTIVSHAIQVMPRMLTNILRRFLWVKFQLDDLCDTTSDKEIRQTLLNLPKDLSETYSRIWTKICASGPGRLATARKMFKWILCAQRPLRIEELREAVALDLGDSCLDEDKLPSGDSWRLIQMCGNLAILSREDSTVRLAHHTVKQFLVSQRNLVPTSPSLLAGASLKDIELEIGQLCITYLCFSDFETQITKREVITVGAGTDVLQSFVYSQLPTSSALGKLAASVLSAGWTETPIKRRPVTVDMSNYKWDKPMTQGLREKYRLLDYVVHNWTKHATALTPLASNWGRLKDVIFERQFMFDVKPWDMDMYTPEPANFLPYLAMFRWAVDEGFITFLKLLENPPSAPDIWEYCTYEAANGVNPLLRATKAGHLNVLTYFYSLHNSRDRGPEDLDLNVIIAIAMHASPVILDSLSQWIDTSTQKKHVLKRLSVQFWGACKSGNIRLATALVTLGANINVRVKDSLQFLRSPLEMATESRDAEIVNLILLHDPDISSRFESLGYAIENDLTNIIPLLSDTDAPTLAEMLFAAISVNHILTYGHLLHLGADVNFHPTACDPPLFVAVRNHHTVIMEMMLQNPQLDIFALDAQANTFLHHAARFGFDLRDLRSALLPHLQLWPELLHARNLAGYNAMQIAIDAQSDAAFEFLAETNDNEHELLEALSLATSLSAVENVNFLFRAKKAFFPADLVFLFSNEGLQGVRGYFASLDSHSDGGVAVAVGSSDPGPSTQSRPLSMLSEDKAKVLEV